MWQCQFMCTYNSSDRPRQSLRIMSFTRGLVASKRSCCALSVGLVAVARSPAVCPGISDTIRLRYFYVTGGNVYCSEFLFD